MSEEIITRNADRYKTKIAQPEWMPAAIKSVTNTLSLYSQGKLPKAIAGWMIVSSCRHLLRCVYGDDLTAAAAIRKLTLEDQIPLTQEEIERVENAEATA